MRLEQEEHFTQFVRAHSATLFRTAYLMTKDYQRAEDLLQTTLLKVAERWSRVAEMGDPVAYSRRVLINQTVSWWRLRSSRESPKMLRQEPGWNGRMDEVDEHDRVWAAVLTLPPKQRAVTVLRYYEDLSEAQIADVLGIAPGTVKSRSHAAMLRLAALLGPSPVEMASQLKEATS